jgi:hypothetical protein
MSNDRRQYFRYKLSEEVYTIDTDISTDDHLVVYPLNYKHSSSPVYFFVLGSWTPTIYAEAHALATSNDTEYGALDRFTDTQIAINDYYDNKTEFFGGGGVNTNREFILSGFSYGAIRALFSYTNLYQKISKCILFNPWIGKYNTGYSSDPLQYMNGWYNTQIQLILDSYNSTVPLQYQNVYTNIIDGDFASKYWTMEREWSETTNTTSIAWGVNFIKTGYIAYGDTLPNDDIQSYLARVMVGTSHTIDNWLTRHYTTQSILNYLPGIKIFTSYLSYNFPNYPDSSIPSHFHISSTGLNGALGTENVQGVGYDADIFKWDFNPTHLNGSHTIINEETSQSVDIIIEYIGENPINGKYYTIRSQQNDYLRIRYEDITEGYLEQREPIRLGLEQDNIAVYQAAADKTPYFWYLEDATNIGTQRRILTTDQYDPFLYGGSDLTIGFTYYSQTGTLDSYNIPFYLYDIGGGNQKWGHINVGSIENYKINLSHTTGDLFNLYSNTYDANTAMYIPSYEICYYDTNRYLIKNTDVINSGTYLKKPTFDQWNTLQLNTVQAQLNNTTTYFLDMVWEQYDPLTQSPDDFLFNIDLYSNIQIPVLLGDSLTNNVNGVLTNTFLIYPQYLRSPNGDNILTMERNGNLIIWTPSGAPFHTNSYNDGNALVIKSDGNLVVFGGGTLEDLNSPVKWNSGTGPGNGTIVATYGSERLIKITDDAKFQIYDGSNNLIKEYS